jgi:TonB-dependent receptor
MATLESQRIKYLAQQAARHRALPGTAFSCRISSHICHRVPTPSVASAGVDPGFVLTVDSAVRIDYNLFLTALSVPTTDFFGCAQKNLNLKRTSKTRRCWRFFLKQAGGSSMHKASFRKTPLATGVALALGASAMTPAKAQQEEVIEEIVTVGIRSSLISSMNTKRAAKGVVDAITAEDIGKFPDTNLAESMQRIPGVSIDRNNNEGSRVTVRGFGPEFNLVLLNGRQMPTSNLGADSVRSWDFANVAAEGVRAVNVLKTFNAANPSGGIGSTIDLRTARPFDNPGMVASFGVKALSDTTNETGDDWTPELSGIFSTTFADDTMGIGVFFSQQDRDSRTVGVNVAEQFWRENLEAAGSQAFPATLVDNRVNTTNTFFPRALGLNVTDISRTRSNAALAFQYAPTDNITATLDYTYAEYDNYQESLASGIWFNDNEVFEGEIDENGAYTYVNARPGDWIGQKNWGAAHNEVDSIGLNLDWQVNDDLNLSLDMHDSEAISEGKDRGNNVFIVMGAVCIDEKAFDARNGAQIPDMYVTFANCLGADSNGEPTGASYESLFGAAFKNFNESNVRQVQLDGEWFNGSSDEGLTSIQFGVANTEMEYRTRERQTGQIAGGWYGGNQDVYDDDIFTRVSTEGLVDEFSGFERNVPFYHDWDLERGVANFEAAYTNGKRLEASFDDPDDITTYDHIIDEKTQSAYIQVNLEGDFNNMPITVVGGIRYEDTEVAALSEQIEVKELVWVAAGVTSEWSVNKANTATRSNVGGDYSLWLPNLDVSMDVRDDMIARFSYSKSITRPSLTNMRGTVSTSDLPKPGQRDANAGNPDLEPFTSDNLDLSFEWYYDEGSYASIGYYRKQVENFIVTQQFDQTIGNLRDPAEGPRAIQARADIEAAGGDPNDLGALFAQININQGAPVNQRITQLDEDPLVTWKVNVPTNLETATLYGWEFAIQHMFGDSGFGVSANATIVEGDINVDNSAIGFQFVLTGLSDSANLIAFYEADKWEARVAYNWRDEFLNGTRNNSPHYTEEYAQWDARASYLVNDNLQIFVEGINLTNESQRIYNRYPNQFTDANQFKARYAIGARYTFE